MMTVACSNAAGGGSDSKDDKDKGNGTEQGTDDEPEIQSGEAPEIIEDDNYVGIKIKITDIPTETYARRIYVNDRVAGEDFSYGDNGALITNQYAKKSEWGYPFVQADKSYKIVVEFIGADYQTIKRTAPLKITAKKGLGDLVCPNAEYVVEDNILKFKKGAPVIYYGNNTNIKEYSNKKSGPSYAIQVFSDGWADNQYFFFGGEDLSQNTFDFAKNLKKELVTDNKLLLRVWAGLEDKDYGGYVYQIAYDKPFYLELDKFPKDIFDITQYFPSIDDLKGKVLQETPSKSQYIEFSSEVDSEGKLPGTLHTYSEGKQSWKDISILYKDGTITNNGKGFPLISDGPGLYCALYSGIRVAGEGRYGTFQFEGDAPLTLSENGTYSVAGKEGGTYTFDDGIINFKDGSLNDHIAIYDGKTIHLILYFFMTIDELPNPLPNPINSSTAVDEVGAPYAKISEVTPQNKDLWTKIFHFTSSSDEGLRDLFFEFANEDSDTYGSLNVSMYPYGINTNGEYTGPYGTGPYGQNTYTYNAGTLAPLTSNYTSSYLIFHVNKKYYASPDGVKFERVEDSGTGLYCTFSYQGITLSLNSKGEYSWSNGTLSYYGKYTNKNGIITLENDSEGNQDFLYDAEYLYLLIEFIPAKSLPTVSNTSTGSDSNINWSNYSYLSGTYTATVTMTNTKTDENGQEIQETETSTDTLSVILDKKAFIWTREFDDGCLWFSGNLKIQKNQDTQADELILSCTKQAETSSFSEEPQDTDWQPVNADSYASFTKNTITIYAEDAIVTKTDAEGNILSSEKGEKVQLSNPIIFSKIEG